MIIFIFFWPFMGALSSLPEQDAHLPKAPTYCRKTFIFCLVSSERRKKPRVRSRHPLFLPQTRKSTGLFYSGSAYPQPSLGQTFCTPLRLVSLMVKNGQAHLGQGSSIGLFQTAYLQSG